jgi:4-hydroxybenzoyl-CoA reductase subunit alpha
MSKKKKFNSIGKPRRRVDGAYKVTGQTVYAGDIHLPRMLHCKLLRSHMPHARIKHIDTSRAEREPGVHLVLTGKDFKNDFGILPVSQDEPPLCRDKVRLVGDPVAAVIAIDEFTAQEALELIDVEYKPLPTISDIFEAIEPVNDPKDRLHEYGEEGNIHRRLSYEFGDVEEILSQSDHVFEDVFFYEGNTHMAMEEHAAVAAIEPNNDGRVTLWSSTQNPHYAHRAIAKALEIPLSRIRIIACHNGGGFGGKCDPFNHDIVIIRATMILGRPVKINLTREEVFYMHRGRHPVLMKFRTGVNRDGKLTGMHLQTILDGGAYGSHGIASTFYTAALQPLTYHLPRYAWDACRVFTNKPPCGPKRGHGTPQPRFGQEVQMDKIAEKLNMDPAELRLNILEKANTVTASYARIHSNGLEECIKTVVKRSGWNDKFGKLPHGKGIGLACSSYQTGASHAIYWNKMPHSGVQLKLDRSGKVAAFCGTTEIGQGSDDVLANLVCEVLGIDPIDVRVFTGDTDLTPVDLGSYSSRVTLMMGNAAIQAAQRARTLIADAVSEKLIVPVEQLVFANSRVTDSSDPNKGMSFQEAVVCGEEKYGTLGSTGSYYAPKQLGKYRGSGVGTSPTYSFTACIVEIEVDPDTGWMHVPVVYIAHDIGRVLNPVLARGQIIGSVYMGLGEALMEEQAFRRLPQRLSSSLVHRNPSLLEYKTLTAHDMPEIFVDMIESDDPIGPFGAKEVGQGPLLPVIPAVVNAIHDAVGVRIDQVPVSPELILKALEKKAKGDVARVGPEKFPELEWPEPFKVPPPWEGGDGNAINKPARKRAAKMHDMDKVKKVAAV